MLAIGMASCETNSKENVISDDVEEVDSLTSLQIEALNESQRIIVEEFAKDAKFGDCPKVLPTSRENMFKVHMFFTSEIKGGWYRYRMFLENLNGKWLQGKTNIEDKSGKIIFIDEGDIKTPYEAEDFHIIHTRMNHPNFIKLYTEFRLSRDEVIKVYDIFKESYNIVQMSVGMTPEDEEYLSIQDGVVYEFDKNKTTKLKDF